MAMPKYRITPADQPAAERWIVNHLSSLSTVAQKKYRMYSSEPAPAALDGFIDLFLSADQRRLLHAAIRQARLHRKKQKENLDELTIVFSGETVARLNYVIEWKNSRGGKTSRTGYLSWLIEQAYNDAKFQVKHLKEVEERTIAMEEQRKKDAK